PHARNSSGRIFRAAWPLRMRQNHTFTHACGLRGADRRPHLSRRRRYRFCATTPAAREPDVPELRVVPAPHGGMQYRLWPAAGEGNAARKRGGRQGEVVPCGFTSLGEAADAPVVGRSAPAGGGFAFVDKAPALSSTRGAVSCARQEVAC